MKKYSIIVFLLLSLGAFSQNSEMPNFYQFSLTQYRDFLIKLKNNPQIVFVLQKDFENFNDTTKIAVSIRHDVDVDISTAQAMAKIESDLGIYTTYFILHTADYYHPKNDFSTHNSTILEKMQYIQNLGSEIGIHNDLLTLQVVYNISPTYFLNKELEWMRENGLKIYGSASHGAPSCSRYGYLNYYFFYECYQELSNPVYPNSNFVIKDNDTIHLEKANISDFGFNYESYCLDYNKYYSDCSKNPDGTEYNPTSIDYLQWKPGDKIIFLFHPIHWSVETKNKLEVYPNPCKNYIQIFFSDFVETKNLTVKIFDIYGSEIFNQNVFYNHGANVKFDIHQGLYFMNVIDISNNKTYTKKIIIK